MWPLVGLLAVNPLGTRVAVAAGTVMAVTGALFRFPAAVVTVLAYGCCLLTAPPLACAAVVGEPWVAAAVHALQPRNTDARVLHGLLKYLPCLALDDSAGKLLVVAGDLLSRVVKTMAACPASAGVWCGERHSLANLALDDSG